MKGDRVELLLAEVPEGVGDVRFRAFFHHFNAGRYYEAHDVLESLWLEQGREHPDHRFHKGLIQLAGGFVHLRLQRMFPEHRAHGRRLGPARRLFEVAARNLAGYPAWHHGFEVGQARQLLAQTIRALEECPGVNPWDREGKPSLRGPG
ncbi:MAG: DUF309 domain-containing protein [Verrucomicrobiia bacterium]